MSDIQYYQYQKARRFVFKTKMRMLENGVLEERLR